MKFVNSVIHFHFWLANKDFIWWPFSFLKPNPSTPITFKLTLIMSLCFGGSSALILSFMALINHQFTASYIFNAFPASFLLFFCWFNIVTRPLWNLKIKKLTKHS